LIIDADVVANQVVAVTFNSSNDYFLHCFKSIVTETFSKDTYRQSS